MRYSFLSASYQLAVAFIFCLATGLIALSWNSGIIDPKLNEFLEGEGRKPPKRETVKIADTYKPWAPVSVEAGRPEQVVVAENLYPPQAPNAPQPKNSARYNNLVENLFSAITYYGHPPVQHEGVRLTHEYDRETGGGRVVDAAPWQDILTEHLAYLAALELHHAIFPETALFSAERANMHRIAKKSIAAAPSIDDIARDITADVQPYWLARQIAELSGDPAYTAFADTYAQGLTPKVSGIAGLLVDGRPLSVNPSHFGLPAVAHDVAERTNDPELRRHASEVMNYLVQNLYDPQSRTIYNDFGTGTGAGSDTREAVDQFTAIDGLWRYVKLTGDSEAARLASALSSGYFAGPDNTSPISPMLDSNLDVFRLYATTNAKGTYAAIDGTPVIAARLNFGAMQVVQAMNSATGFGAYDQEYALARELFEQKFYDDIYNGFYDSYELVSTSEYSPIGRGDHYFLQIDIPIYFAYLEMRDRYERKQLLESGRAAAAAGSSASTTAPVADGSEPDAVVEAGDGSID